MDALIFSVSAGGGHGHAAEAIRDYIQLNEPSSMVQIIDTLKYINPILDKVIIGSYLKTIKITPSLFGKLYDCTYGYSETDFGLTSVSNKIIEMLTYKLLPLIEDLKPKVLISTHPFTTEMLSTLRLKYDITLPTVSVLTDYAPHNSWLHPGIDAYITSNSDMVEEMEARGIDVHTIFNYGIPVKPNFLAKYNRKETLKELSLEDKPTLLIMGGSLGLGNIPEIYGDLMTIDKDFQIVIITGNNKKLYSELLELSAESNKRTAVIGYTEHVNQYMQACDLLLTKPGGLTITEALIAEIPLAIFSPLPGQEEKNSEFLLKHNLAIDLGDGKNCAAIIQNLLSAPETLLKMKKNCSEYSNPASGMDIYNLLCDLIKNNPLKLNC